MMKGPSNLPTPHASKPAQQAVVMPPTTKSGTVSFEAIAWRIFIRAHNVMALEEFTLYFLLRRGTIAEPDHLRLRSLTPNITDSSANDL